MRTDVAPAGTTTVSTFEFLNSGTVARLKSYLLGAPHCAFGVRVSNRDH